MIIITLILDSLYSCGLEHFKVMILLSIPYTLNPRWVLQYMGLGFRMLGNEAEEVMEGHGQFMGGYKGVPKRGYRALYMYIWGIVKIMVPFWVP